MGYWEKVARRAWSETRSEARFDTPVRVAVTLGSPLAAGGGTWWATHQLAWGTLASFSAFGVVVLATFAVKLCLVPPRMAAAYEAEIRALRPSADSPRIPLATAAQYIVEESSWSLGLKPDDDHFIRYAAIELKDKLQQGLLGARGRHIRPNGRNLDRGPEDIPAGFWPGAELQVWDMLRGTAAPTVTNDATVWADITVSEGAVKAAWPPLRNGQKLNNRYIEAQRNARGVKMTPPDASTL